MSQDDWWDTNGFEFLSGDQQMLYPGGSATFDEGAAGSGQNVPIDNGQTGDISLPPGVIPWSEDYPGKSNTPLQPMPQPQSGSQRSGNPQADWQAFVQSKGYSGTYARTHMPQLVNEFNAAYGYNASAGTPNARGEIDGADFGGGFVDLVHGGDDAWQWYQDNGSVGGAVASGGARPGELQNYGVPSNPYASAAYGGGYTAPTWGQSFTAPQLNESTDPGLQARFNFGHQALERSAAAKGTILNGGTQQALEMFGQDYASNEYANVFSRAFDQYKQKYGEFSDAANLGLRAEQNQYGEYLGEQNRTLNDYLTNYNIGRTGIQDLLNQQNKTADRGLNATIAGRP